jgi:AcrR family transcriptional regulator
MTEPATDPLPTSRTLTLAVICGSVPSVMKCTACTVPCTITVACAAARPRLIDGPWYGLILITGRLRASPCLASKSCKNFTFCACVWNQTIEAHRREVRDAILHTAVALVAKHGLHSVTMSQIAEETGIGRATLYKYFPDVEAILVAWHDRHVAAHLEHLAEVRDKAGNAGERLEAVLQAYALITYERPQGTELAGLMHRREHIAEAHQQLRSFIRDLLPAAGATGDLRDDVSTDELASYCLHALSAASSRVFGAPATNAVGCLRSFKFIRED